MKIAIARTGYVGLSNAMLLPQHNEVVALNIVPEKFELLNQKILQSKTTRSKTFWPTCH